MIREIKEKPTAGSVLKEKVRSVPRELVRRGVDDGTERLRGQLRDAVQHGQQDNYGDDQIEDAASAGGQQIERAAEKLLIKKKHGRADSHGDSPLAEQPVPEHPAEVYPQTPQERSHREVERPKIKTRENVVYRDMASGEIGGARPSQVSRSIHPEIKKRDVLSPMPSPGLEVQGTRKSGKTVGEGVHIPATGQLKKTARRHDSVHRIGLTDTQGKNVFGQEQRRSVAMSRTGKRKLQTALSHKASGHNTVSGVKFQPAAPPNNTAWGKVRHPSISVKTANSGTKTVGRTGRRTVKLAGAAAPIAVGVSVHTAKKTASSAARAARKAAQSARFTAKTADISLKAAGETAANAIRSAAASLKSLAAAAAAGSWAVIMIIILICLIGLLAASPFGIFFAADDTGEGTVTPAAAVAQINGELSDHLNSLRLSGGYGGMEVHGQPPAWSDVLAVFAAKTAGAADGVSVAVLDQERVALLRTVFWDMTKITTEEKTVEHPASGDIPAWTETVLSITITPRIPDDMRAFYLFTEPQNQALDGLLAHEDMLISLAGDLTITDRGAMELLAHLPDDLSPERRAVVETACRLVGKVNYFWGGKSRVLGWDVRWGTLQKVWASGSPTTGTWRPYGLDCSGFVDWVFYNISGGEYVIGHGGGARMQHCYCTNISWEEAQPGDLVFYPGDEHVGIVGGRDENGNLLVIHCASSANNVVITGANGFVSVARPEYYNRPLISE